MNRIDFNIPIYDWKITVVTDFNKKDLDNLINEFNIENHYIPTIYEYLENDAKNGGEFFHNDGKRTILLMIYDWSEISELVSVVSHEIRHIVDAIAINHDFYREKEAVAYLTGFLSKKIFESSHTLFQCYTKCMESEIESNINNNVIFNQNIEFVDLGLPSGTKWMKCNLGAEKETDYGLYYQWGATKGYTGDEAKAHSYWETCPFNDSDIYNEEYWNSVKDTILDSGSTLKAKYDCVYQSTNGIAKLPTKEQVDELCTLPSVWKAKSGVYGREFTGYNGNKLFIPAASYVNCDSFVNVGNDCCCWSSSLYTDSEKFAWYSYGNTYGVGSYCYGNRYIGCSARGVLS